MSSDDHPVARAVREARERRAAELAAYHKRVHRMIAQRNRELRETRLRWWDRRLRRGSSSH